MKTWHIVSLSIVAFILLILVVWSSCTPSGVAFFTRYQASLTKAGDNNSFRSQKEVENTARAMIASYNSDILTYEQFRDSHSEEKQSWAEQAKMRANKTAMSYNEYILKNSFVWKDNVPDDIFNRLESVR